MSLTSKYNWGVDGKGRAHICKEDDNAIILCMINGSGQEGVWLLESQDLEESLEDL